MDLRSLVAVLQEALQPWMDRRCVFFGHSMGALVAFELARALRRDGARLPTHLIMSGAPAPHVKQLSHALHTLPDEEFLQNVAPPWRHAG